MKKRANSEELLRNVKVLYDRFGNRLNTGEKWVVAYWQQIDRVEVEDGKISVSDIINNATNPVHILDTVSLYKIMRQVK